MNYVQNFQVLGVPDDGSLSLTRRPWSEVCADPHRWFRNRRSKRTGSRRWRAMARGHRDWQHAGSMLAGCHSVLAWPRQAAEADPLAALDDHAQAHPELKMIRRSQHAEIIL